MFDTFIDNMIWAVDPFQSKYNFRVCGGGQGNLREMQCLWSGGVCIVGRAWMCFHDKISLTVKCNNNHSFIISPGCCVGQKTRCMWKVFCKWWSVIPTRERLYDEGRAGWLPREGDSECRSGRKLHLEVWGRFTIGKGISRRQGNLSPMPEAEMKNTCLKEKGYSLIGVYTGEQKDLCLQGQVRVYLGALWVLYQ